MKTYKTATFGESLLPTMIGLKKKYDNPINFIKTSWEQIAPDWAVKAIPYMIKTKTLFLKTHSQHAMIIQFREKELLEIVSLILNTHGPNSVVEKIKILKL
jgi:hypothetical protein